jgi:hypothetical protein
LFWSTALCHKSKLLNRRQALTSERAVVSQTTAKGFDGLVCRSIDFYQHKNHNIYDIYDVIDWYL